MGEEPQGNLEHTRRLLMAKALGFTNAISKLSRAERSLNPSGNFGNDYNVVRKIVMQNFPRWRNLFHPPSR